MSNLQISLKWLRNTSIRTHDSKMFPVVRFNDALLLFWLTATSLIRKIACSLYVCAWPKRLWRLTIRITSKHCTNYSKRTSSKRRKLDIFNIKIVDRRYCRSCSGCTLQRSNMLWIHDIVIVTGYFKMINLLSCFTYHVVKHSTLASFTLCVHRTVLLRT